MKKFLLKFLFLISPLIILGVLFEGLLRNIPNDYKFKKEFLEKKSADIEVLSLGNSHTYYGVNPVHFELKAFNASHIGQSIDLDYKILAKYKDNFKKLKVITINIDYMTLFSSTSSGDEAWRFKNYCIYYDVANSFNLRNYSEVLSFNLRQNFMRFNKYYLKNSPDIWCDGLGFSIDKTITTPYLNSSGKIAALSHTRKNNKFLEKNIKVVKAIIELANTMNAKVIFYTSPSHKNYVRHLEKEQLDISINTIKNIVAKSENSYYYNYLTTSQFLDSDYRDADHLNGIGAKKLSLLLNKSICQIDMGGVKFKK